MDEEEDDVFPHEWSTTFGEIKCEDRGTQTPGPALDQGHIMLPCGVSEEPRRLFHGNAGFRLHFPARFERVVYRERDEVEIRPADRPRHSAEVRIGQKLQMIGDQFHREHVQLHRRNQRNQRAVWWHLAMAFYSLLFGRRREVAR